MATGIIVVRHGMPAIERDVPSVDWQLSEGSRGDCALLADALPASLAPVIFSSPQAKTVGTASVIAEQRGLTVTVDERLREAGQPHGWVEDYRSLAARYVGGEPVPGWEPHAEVVARFKASIDELVSVHERDFVVVSHGLAPSLFLQSRCGIDVVPFWRALSLPDAWRLDCTDGSLTRLVQFAPPLD